MHATLPPSSAERIVLCHGSVRMTQAVGPVDDDQDTRDGVAAHYAAAHKLHLGGIDWKVAGEIADNGVVLTDEMVEGADMYADHIIARGPVGNVEKPVGPGPLNVENWGTPDHWYFDPTTTTLYIDDFKFGRRYVDPFRNWQLANYAALVLASLGLWGHDGIRVVCTIVQPRSYHRSGPIRAWETSTNDVLLRDMWGQLIEAFKAALRPDAQVTPHPDACRDCPARHDCEGSLNASNIGMDLSYQSEPLHMSPAAMAREYRKLVAAETFIKSRREGMQQRIEQTIRRSRSVPGFSIEHRPGREVWNDSAVADGVVEIAAHYNVVIAKPDVSLITPKQAIKAGVPEHVVRLFSKSNGGAAELVEDDGSQAARIFNPK